MKQEDYKRQLVIANSLYEMGVDINLIKQITTVKKVDLENNQFQESIEALRNDLTENQKVDDSQNTQIDGIKQDIQEIENDHDFTSDRALYDGLYLL